MKEWEWEWSAVRKEIVEMTDWLYDRKDWRDIKVCN